MPTVGVSSYGYLLFFVERSTLFTILVQSKNVFLESLSTITDFKTLARAITLVENDTQRGAELLRNLTIHNTPIIGITGPPGAGKSTLLNALVHDLLQSGKRIGLILVDPSSPFHFGALLGDRLRMTQHFMQPNLFIRSVASRGSLGGLSDKIIEITEVMKAYPFDYIFVETVGVGQSEVEIAGLADTTVVVLVPESGDGVQAMKAGLMEIADLFVVNKSDRPDAELFYNHLSRQLEINHRNHIPILKTVASESLGIAELHEVLEALPKHTDKERKLLLLSNKVYRIIQQQRMKSFDKSRLLDKLKEAVNQPHFSLFKFAFQFDDL